MTQPLDLTFELTQMEQRLSEMEEKIDAIDTKLTQVVDAILGNPLTKTGGFVDEIKVLKEKVEVIERKQEHTEEFKKRVLWTVGIIVTLALIIQYVLNIYSNIKK
jgi:hypothetical protein